MEQHGIYTAAIYCRLSKDDEQAGESVSIGMQKSLLEGFCREQGFLVHDFYVDDGYSGLNFDRPDFQRLLNDIDNGRVNLVVTKDLSRLGCDYIQTGYYTDVYFSRKNIRYIAVNDGVDTSRDDNDIAPFRNILNDLYAKDLSRKVKAAKRQRAKDGYFISAQAPYGYRPDPANRNRLALDEEAAAVVRRIFALALSGLGGVRIAKRLTAERVPNPSAHKAHNGDTRFSRYNRGQSPEKMYTWCYETVKAILRDRVYVGDMVNHKCEIVSYKTRERRDVPEEQRIVVPNTHEPLVSREDFERVQALFRARPTPSACRTENIFRGVLFCPECGHPLSMAHTDREQGGEPYYRCMYHYRHPDECAHTHAIAYDTLYNAVLERIRRTAEQFHDDAVFARMVAERAGLDASVRRLETERDKLARRRQELSGLLRRLFEEHAAGLLTDENYAAFTKQYQTEQADILRRMSALEARLAGQNDYRKNAEKLREALRDHLRIDRLTPLVLGKLVERIEVGQAEWVDGERRQEVVIGWRFAGVV
ncbi:recombinase family protein [Ethanoligenens sp.]|uniref:recombinase family protein n=1 Tax=Ethanoligenens sp. TaxID=2099655 RepID=UPI0039ECC6F4